MVTKPLMDLSRQFRSGLCLLLTLIVLSILAAYWSSPERTYLPVAEQAREQAPPLDCQCRPAPEHWPTR